MASYSTSVPYSSDAKGSGEGYASEQGDLPYEPPKQSFTEFDTGPGPSLARALMGGEPGLGWPDFKALGAAAHPSFGYGPIYRGRPGEARILVLADQESHDDLFTFRAMTGDAGQRFQEFLLAMGITKSYLILRVLPVDTLGLSATQVDRSSITRRCGRSTRRSWSASSAAGTPHLRSFVGQHARRLRTHVMPAGLPVVEMKAWRESGSLADWKRALRRPPQHDLSEGRLVPQLRL